MHRLFLVAVVVLSVLVLIAPADAQISFVEPLKSWVAPGSQDGAYGVAVADFNRDGKPDVAFLQSTSGVSYVSVMLGNGGGTFAAPVNVFTFPANDYSQGILARDFNGDGKMDIAFTVHQLQRDCGPSRQWQRHIRRADHHFDDAGARLHADGRRQR